MIHMAGKTQLLLIFIYGIRFDVFSVFITNALLIVLHLAPLKLFLRKNYQRLLKIVFYTFNIPALLLNCIDFVYFRFTQKRTTGDLFTPEMAGDISNNAVNYIIDFWYVLVVLFIILFLTAYSYRKVKMIEQGNQNPKIWVSTLYITSILFFFIVGARGGLQFKPITMQTAVRYAPPQLIPLVLNTPFTVIKTWNKEGLAAKKYMDDSKADLLFSIYQKKNHVLPIRKMNVVIIIMESFSKEYIGFFNHGFGYTPFLDSLCKKSYVFTKAFANSKRSIEGIPAITTSIPALMDEPFITSAYNTSKINSVAGILKKQGYHSAFFHGGNNGTMGFENFSMLAGYEKYSGRNEYVGPASDYDGSWGIYDVPYFAFFKSQMDRIEKPFCSTIFSLSSHHPYSLPPSYKNKFPKGDQPILQSVGYADFALQNFFRLASQASWYSNTLFVITADHTGPAISPYYQTSKGIFEIPIIYFCPADSALNGINNNVTQQCDILPSILDYLYLNEHFSSFGNSVFSSDDHFSINYNSNLFQFFDNEYMLQFDGENTVGFYHYSTDSFLVNNLNGQKLSKQHQLEMKTKAVIQQYRKAMLQNTIIKR